MLNVSVSITPARTRKTSVKQHLRGKSDQNLMRDRAFQAEPPRRQKTGFDGERTHSHNSFRLINPINQPTSTLHPTTNPPRITRIHTIDITRDMLNELRHIFRRDRFDALFEIVDISIEGIDAELDVCEFVDAG